MQPNQPVGSPSPGQNPYDFIMNPSKPPRKSLFGGNSSFTKKIIILVGGALLVMIILAVAMSLLTSDNGGNTSSLKELAAQQQELVRIATIGTTEAQDSTIRSKAITTQLSVTTQQQELTKYLESRDIKLSKEELAIKKNSNTDKILEAAKSSNNFDSVFDEELTEQLKAYATDLQSAYNSMSNENGKNILSESYTSTAFILGVK